MDRKEMDTMRKAQLLFLLLWMPLMAHAEHLFEAGLRVGMADYRAQCTYVSPVPSLHAGVQLSYSYHSSRVVGMRAGATIDRHQAGFGKNGYTDTYKTIDIENEPIQIDYTIGRLREMYTTWSVGIPLQLALTGKQVAFYIGPKVVFPLQCTWTENADNAALSVYFPKQDNRVYESFPLAASRSFKEVRNGTHNVQKIQWWLAAELCYDIPVYTAQHSKSYLSVGIYADFSLSRETDPVADRSSLMMLSDTRDGFPLHRELTSVVTALRQEERLVSSRNLFDVGLKLSYRIAPYNPLKKNAKECKCYFW
ncbi:MAG: hypothetical protein PUD97_04520 [Paludibacteraceae bacterium]|nr:hypothetical protein [Paludibacteraceae bacterium]